MIPAVHQLGKRVEAMEKQQEKAATKEELCLTDECSDGGLSHCVLSVMPAKQKSDLY